MTGWISALRAHFWPNYAFFSKSLLSQKQLRAIGLLPREKAEKDDEDDLQEDQCWDVNGHAPRVPRLQHLSHLSQPHPGALFLDFSRQVDFWPLDPSNAQFGPARSTGHRLLGEPAIPLLWLSRSCQHSENIFATFWNLEPSHMWHHFIMEWYSLMYYYEPYLCNQLY